MKGKKIPVAFLAGTLLCAAVAALSCKAGQVKTTVHEPEEKTAFYTIGLLRDTLKQQTRAELKQLTVVDTRTRYLPDEAKTREPNFLRIEVTYKNNRVVQAVTEHPLYKRFDLYEESGQIESKLISLQQGEVVFRVPYFEAYKKIRIIETINFKESQTIVLQNEK